MNAAARSSAGAMWTRRRMSAASASSSRAAPRRYKTSMGGPQGQHARRVAPTRVINSEGVFAGDNYMLLNGMVDYYAVLGVDDDAGPDEIKRAYRSLAKSCHPDVMGDEQGHNVCILLNEAYDTLSNPDERAAYNASLEQALIDFEDDYTGKALSKWMPTQNPRMAKNEDPAEDRAVFVDEFSCIGCKMCVWCASATFRMEPQHGRSRVFAQWLDSEDKIQQSIDSCPVSCIHWVKQGDLPSLEYVTQVKLTERTNVGIMMSGSAPIVDVFQQTVMFLKERKRREEAAEQQARKTYSAAQAAARRKASEMLKQKKSGWVPNMEDFLAGAFASFGGIEPGTHVGNESKKGKVGSRRRAMRWDELLQRQEEVGTIPLERALVPISIAIRDD